MKFSLACITALAGFAAAQNDVQSKPFKLSLCSNDKSLNGKQLTACHTGAAIESLCLYDGAGSDFRFNTTKGSTSQLKGFTPEGELAFRLIYNGGSGSVSEPMYFFTDASTNVALPLFTPSESDVQYVAFDKKTEALRVISYLDDSKKPVAVNGPRALDRWYICNTNYLGYQYKTLNWVLGNGKPQNPSCKKVDVKRKF